MLSYQSGGDWLRSGHENYRSGNDLLTSSGHSD